MKVSGRSTLDYVERILPPLADGAARSIRLYRTSEFKRTVGDQPQESSIRPAVRRMVVLRLGTREAPFSPDGPLTFGEIDLVRTDVYTPALVGLLPGQAVQVGERWPALLNAVEELTDMERIDQGGLECQLSSIGGEGRRQALITFAGTVRGVNEDGPTQQQLSGNYTFDLEARMITAINLTATKALLDENGQPAGRIEGKFLLNRQLVASVNELSPAALQGLALEPNAANSLLLYEGTTAGVRLIYPRRWRISAEQGRQITLNDPHGNGLLITVESLAKIPTPSEYARENQEVIAKQKGRVLHSEPAQRVGTGDVQRFGMEIEVNNQRSRMEYYIVKHAAGGATIAARLLPNEAAALRPELDQLAASLTIGHANPAGVVPLPNK